MDPLSASPGGTPEKPPPGIVRLCFKQWLCPCRPSPSFKTQIRPSLLKTSSRPPVPSLLGLLVIFRRGHELCLLPSVPESGRPRSRPQQPRCLARLSPWFADGCLLTCPQLAKAEPLSCPFLGGRGPHVWGCTCTTHPPPAGPPNTVASGRRLQCVSVRGEEHCSSCDFLAPLLPVMVLRRLPILTHGPVA